MCEPAPGKGNPTSLDHTHEYLLVERCLEWLPAVLLGPGFCQVSECLLSSHSNPCRYKALAQARTVVKGAEDFPSKHGQWMFFEKSPMKTRDFVD